MSLVGRAGVPAKRKTAQDSEMAEAVSADLRGNDARGAEPAPNIVLFDCSRLL